MDLIARVSPTSPKASLERLLHAPLGLDIWEVKPDYLVLRAGESQLERLNQMGYEVEELEETESHLAQFAASHEIAKYHSVETLEQEMQEMAQADPHIVELCEIGRSVENRPIWALRLGERRDSANKILFMGCHHAREWISVEVPFLLAGSILRQSNQSPVQEWLSRGEIWIVPMVNPDGHEYSRTVYRLWRKNRRQNPDGSIGVDPNRNYGYMWGTLDIPTSSHTPSDPTYVGPRAFSEPETRAVRDLLGRELFRGVITYHSYSELILYPWGYDKNPIEDHSVTDKLATRMQHLIQDVHGVSYKPQQSSQLYPTAGDTTDWTYGIYRIPSFTVELRPATFSAGGFILQPDQILPTAEENFPAAFEFAGHFLSNAQEIS